MAMPRRRKSGPKLEENPVEIEETLPENMEEEKVVELEAPQEVFEEEVSKFVEQEETPPPKIREKLDLRRHVRRHRNIPRFSQSHGNL